MERLRILSPVRKTFENGAIVEARRRDPDGIVEPAKTAKHEAAHVVAAGEIVYATIIPSGDSLGSTQPKRLTAQAAAAAEALGHDGTGWDMYLTEYILGVSPGIAKSAARSALSGKSEEMHEVAVLLEERKTIGQSDVEEARQNVRKRRNGIYPVEVTITMPRKKAKTIELESFKGEISISKDLIRFPERANESEAA